MARQPRLRAQWKWIGNRRTSLTELSSQSVQRLYRDAADTPSKAAAQQAAPNGRGAGHTGTPWSAPPPTASVVPLRGKARQRHRGSLDTRKPGVKALGLPAGLSGSVTKASWSAWVRIGKLVVSGCGEGKRLPSIGGWWAAMSRYRLPEPAPANRCPSTSDAFTVGAAGVTRQSRISIPRPPGIACLNQRNRALAGPSPGLKCVLPRPEQSRFVRLVLYEK